MEKQIIVTIGREFGSGGHEIAEKLANKLQIKLYDRNIIEETALKSGYTQEMIEKYDEKPVIPFLSRRVGNYSNSLEMHVAENEFDAIRALAEKESFVIVGRCAEHVLKQHPHVVTLFILGDKAVKLERVMNLYHLSQADALAKMKRHDKKRKTYHNYYSEGKWGDSRTYDLTINSSRLGIDETVETLYQYIQKRMEKM